MMNRSDVERFKVVPVQRREIFPVLNVQSIKFSYKTKKSRFKGILKFCSIVEALSMLRKEVRRCKGDKRILLLSCAAIYN